MKKMILLSILFGLCFCAVSCGEPKTDGDNTGGAGGTNPTGDPDLLRITAVILYVSDDGKIHGLMTADDVGFDFVSWDQGLPPALDFGGLTPEAGQTVYADIRLSTIKEQDPGLVTAEVVKITPATPAVPARYIRIGSSEEGSNLIVIESKAQLDEYYLTKGRFGGDGLNYFDFATTNNGKSFADAIAKYDDAFFEDNLLVFALLTEGSGSNRHIVKNVDFAPAGNTVNIKRMVPFMGTADIAEWHIIVEINRTDCVSMEFSLNIE